MTTAAAAAASTPSASLCNFGCKRHHPVTSLLLNHSTPSPPSTVFMLNYVFVCGSMRACLSVHCGVTNCSLGRGGLVHCGVTTCPVGRGGPASAARTVCLTRRPLRTREATRTSSLPPPSPRHAINYAPSCPASLSIVSTSLAASDGERPLPPPPGAGDCHFGRHSSVATVARPGGAPPPPAAWCLR